MHEMSIAESILDLIKDSAHKQNFKKVKKVFLELGVFSTIEPESLLFCFDVVTKNSLAENANLIINKIDGKGWCLKCSQETILKSREVVCSSCGSYQIQITSGEDMKIRELEVE